MTGFGDFIAGLPDDTRMEMVVATVSSTSPFTINWDGTDIPNPPSLSFTFALNDSVMCIRQGATFFVLGPIVSRS